MRAVDWTCYQPPAQPYQLTKRLCHKEVWYGHCRSSSGDRGLQEYLWQEFLSDPTRWWDDKWSKKTSRQSYFKLAALMDAGMRRPPDSVSGASGRLAAREGTLEVRTCRKLCEDWQVTQAVKVLDILVQRRCSIPNNLFYRVLTRCVKQKDVVLGRRIHALAVASGYEGDAFLATHLIGLYASVGSLEEAMQVFSKVPTPDIYMWASIIFAYGGNGEPTRAIGLYGQMLESPVEPDNRIYVAILKACASARDLSAGRDVHAHILASAVQPDIFVQTALVDMYAKCGRLEDARRLFDGISSRNVVTWNAMIAGYAQQGMGQEALSLYSSMQQETSTPPDSFTFACLLQACASVGVAALHQGKQLHAEIGEQGLQSDAVVSNSLVNMYAKCGSLEDAQRVFDRLSEKNVVTWTALIAGYARRGMGQEALSLYNGMQHEGVTPPDEVTFVCLLQACASVAALPLAKQLHTHIEDQGLQANAVVGASLINMYAKCGSLEDAQQVFDSLPEGGQVAWGALISGYALHGESDIVFDLVDRMKLEGLQPDAITFLSMLSVCSHVGLVDRGRKYWKAMSTDYNISPTIEHYTCMVDLLGRAGHLEEALEMVTTMPFQADKAVWLTLLGACRKWSNIKVGRQVFEFAVKLDENDGAAYVLMSNIYAGAELWEEAKQMQARRRQCGAWKQPGQSWWSDMDGVVHSFVVGDRKHPQSEGTYSVAQTCP